MTESGVPYAAGPHTLLFYAPTSVLPLAVSMTIWMAIGIAGLGLARASPPPAVWYLLFPPLAHAMWNGNPQTLALALLVAGGPVAAALAVGLKLYAAVPLVGRWRDLIVAGVVLVVTLLILPWQLYLEQGLGVGSPPRVRLERERVAVPAPDPADAARPVGPAPPTARSGSLVPAVFPATQFYYVAMALPALVGAATHRRGPRAADDPHDAARGHRVRGVDCVRGPGAPRDERAAGAARRPRRRTAPPRPETAPPPTEPAVSP